MKRSWIGNLFGKTTRTPIRRFAPRVDQLEDRAVPATFYVDPTATAGSPIFNLGRPDQFTGTFGTDVFDDLDGAIAAANGAAGVDTIRLAHTGLFIPINSAADTILDITDSVSIVGSGSSASVLTTANNQSDAVLRVTGAGVAVNLTDVGFFGGASGFDAGGNVAAPGGQTGTFLRYTVGTTGTVTRSVFQGIYADGFLGVGLEATGTGTSLTVQNSQFSSIGRVGILADAGATANLFTNTYLGKGGGPFIDYFAQVSAGASAVISGNTVSGNQGVAGGNSAAVIIVSNGGPAASAQIFGNNFTGNVVGVIVGDGAADTSSAVLEFNNIAGNFIGVGTNRDGTTKIDAANVWWGTPTGPFNAVNNPTGTGNDVADDVIVAPPRATPVPVLAAPDLPTYLASAFPQVVTIAAVNDAAEPGTAGLFRFTRTGDSSIPLTVNYTVGGTATPGVDYTALPGVVNFAVGQTSIDVPVNVIDDADIEGTETVIVTVTAGAGFTVTGSPATVNITDNDTPPVVPSILPREFAAGTDLGVAPQVVFYNPDGTVRFTDTPSFGGGFTGGVRVAAADFNGDGIADVVEGTGPGVATRVRVIDGVTKAELFSVAPFEAAFTGGVFVSAGDINGDGKAELVITPDEGGGPRVQVYDGNGFAKIADFFGINDPNFRGGARSAIGDIDGDGKAELVVAAGFGGGPRVSVYRGTSIGNGPPVNLFADFFIFEQALRNGAFVAVGDVNGDGFGDLIGGGGPGGGPRVLALSGVDLLANKGDTSAALINFFAGDQNNRAGIRVAAKDLDGDTKADLVVGPGTGAGGVVSAYLGKDFVNGSAAATLNLTPFAGFAGGIFVG